MKAARRLYGDCKEAFECAAGAEAAIKAKKYGQALAMLVKAVAENEQLRYDYRRLLVGFDTKSPGNALQISARQRVQRPGQLFRWTRKTLRPHAG